MTKNNSTQLCRNIRTPSCLSCKKLKIKCDRLKPKCEYCLHMNKDCEYPVPEIININRSHKLLDVSPGEYKLMTFYLMYATEVFGGKPGSPQDAVWRVTIPSMWNSNRFIKDSIYCISSVYQWSSYDLNNIPVVKYADGRSLIEMTSEYFHNCLQGMFEIFSGKAQNTEAKIVLAHAIYGFLCVNPLRVIPLLSLNDDNDVVSIVLGFKKCLKADFYNLMFSMVAPLLYLNEQLDISFHDAEVVNYRFITTLRLKLLQDSTLDQIQSRILNEAVDTLERCIYRSLQHDYPLPLFRSFFALDEEFYRFLKQTGHIAAYKVLYYCASFSLLLNFRIFKDLNIWQDYIDFYKDLNRFESNYFWDEDDQYLYYLIISEQPIISLQELFIV